MPLLRVLDARHNLMAGVGDVAAVVNLPALGTLQLAGNLVARGDYRLQIMARFASAPEKLCIDGAAYDEKARAKIAAIQAELRQQAKEA